jgi:ketosteroid isomerase-like protein
MAKPLLLMGVMFCAFLLWTPLANAQDFDDSVKDATKKFLNAVRVSNGEAIGALYHEDAKLYAPNSDVIEGRQPIVTFWMNTIRSGVKDMELETTDTESEGDLGYESGKYTIYGAERMILDRGKYIVVWKKDDDKWYLYRDIWNTSLPAPAPTP